MVRAKMEILAGTEVVLEKAQIMSLVQCNRVNALMYERLRAREEEQV